MYITLVVEAAMVLKTPSSKTRNSASSVVPPVKTYLKCLNFGDVFLGERGVPETQMGCIT